MNLAAHAENKQKIAGAGAVEKLVAMLAQGGGSAEQAAGALMNSRRTTPITRRQSWRRARSSRSLRSSATARRRGARASTWRAR